VQIIYHIVSYVAAVVVSVWCLVKESLKPAFVKQAAIKLKQVDEFLGSNQWFAGDRVSLFISQRGLMWLLIEVQRLLADNRYRPFDIWHRPIRPIIFYSKQNNKNAFNCSSH